ncbi:MAG: hypothetical protein WC866_00245 [Patescibacteria group bacterium]|jgi:hypothetical protein
MSFETPSLEQPKSEADLLREEISKAAAELAGMPADAPEHDFLKEKLRSYESQLAKLEDDMIEDLTDAVAPELRTPESYGIQKESVRTPTDEDTDTLERKILEDLDKKKRQAS